MDIFGDWIQHYYPKGSRRKFLIVCSIIKLNVVCDFKILGKLL